MSKETRIRELSLTIVIWILWCINIPTTYGQTELWGNQWTGPWVDKILYKPNYNEYQIQLLFEGEIDIIGNNIVSKPHLDELREAECIEVYESLRYGYGITSINCAKYPMNITNFRRAVAFALNKHRCVDDIFGGLARLLDCHIPRQHPACIEDELTYHYYDPDIEKGLELLSDAGFIDSDGDRWLEGPSIEGPGLIELDPIRVEYHPGRGGLAGTVYEALLNLGIPAELWSTPWEDMRIRLEVLGHYDMIFYGLEWASSDLDFYAINYHSEYVDVPYWNYENWVNETWDDLAEVLLHSTDIDEVIQTAKEMEHIWVYECPALIMYQNIYYLVQRTDTFVGIEPTAFFSSRTFWTNMRVHKKDGSPLGGTFIWGTEPHFETSFSPFTYDRYISDMLFDSLIIRDPDGNDVLWMCEDVTILAHADDPMVPEGHTRFLVDIIQNATWSDGTPITAEDFVFSLSFLRDYVPFRGLEDLVACYAQTTYRLFCEVDSETVWDWHEIAYQPLLPKQVWAEYGENYYQNQPTPENLDEMVVSGPFLPTLWIRGEYEELTQNPDYFRNPRKIIPTTMEPSPTTTTDTSSTFDESRFLIGIVAGVLGASVVVLAGGYLIFQYTAPLKVR